MFLWLLSAKMKHYSSRHPSSIQRCQSRNILLSVLNTAHVRSGSKHERSITCSMVPTTVSRATNVFMKYLVWLMTPFVVSRIVFRNAELFSDMNWIISEVSLSSVRWWCSKMQYLICFSVAFHQINKAQFACKCCGNAQILVCKWQLNQFSNTSQTRTSVLRIFKEDYRPLCFGKCD